MRQQNYGHLFIFLLDIELVERVQTRFTQRLPGLKFLTFETRLDRNQDTERQANMTFGIVNGHIHLSFYGFF